MKKAMCVLALLVGSQALANFASYSIKKGSCMPNGKYYACTLISSIDKSETSSYPINASQLTCEDFAQGWEPKECSSSDR